ncbi:MAG: ATP-binding protein [Methylobacteriaceae bacterium]|jgi:AAA15 family ATPase/GTPase|nr:ATP-binding protein [Methylobacteriaceae bacterium]
MLVEFTVTNYKSIAAPQKLSLVPGKSSSGKPDRSAPTGNSLAGHALRSAVILGANGSGKSNFMAAVDFFSTFVERSAKDSSVGDTIDVVPFKLSGATRAAPAEFEAIFVHEDALFQYGFAVDNRRVREEWLFSRPNEPGRRMRTLFRRAFDEDTGDYAWDINDVHVKGDRETWRKATRDNALFLSTAVQLNSSSLKAPYIWITEYLRTLPPPDRVSPDFSAHRCRDGKGRRDILKFLKSADLGIADIAVEEQPLVIPQELEKGLSDTELRELREHIGKSKVLKTSTFHTSAEKEKVRFDLEEESAGTQVLFALAGIWLDVLETGYTLFVDELNNSLHPFALKYLIEMFHDPAINPKGAQLVFTAHDATVISGQLMHKDQIWFMELNENSATHLFPLSDFDVRDTEAFARGYLNGRFGGLPRITEFDFGEE